MEREFKKDNINYINQIIYWGFLQMMVVSLIFFIQKKVKITKNMVTAPVERRRVDHHFQGFHKYVKQKTLKKPVKKQMHIPASLKK